MPPIPLNKKLLVHRFKLTLPAAQGALGEGSDNEKWPADSLEAAHVGSKGDPGGLMEGLRRSL